MTSSCNVSFDVVVIGAGIIGLSIARKFLLHSDFSIAVVDASVLCSGATGAGQGYIWMAHKTRGSETWDLVKRSHQLWHQLAESWDGRKQSVDVQCTVEFLQKGNKDFASQGRYAEFFCDPAVHLIRSQATGKIEGVKTKKNTLHGKKAVILAAGCWTVSLMKELIQDLDVVLNVPVQPRKGVLLVVEHSALKLNHALMEIGYNDHLISPLQPESSDHGFSISMGVTVDADGNLLLGSSREFAGFNTEIDMGVINSIWERAEEFFLALKQLSLNDLREKWKARVGLPPYSQ